MNLMRKIASALGPACYALGIVAYLLTIVHYW